MEASAQEGLRLLRAFTAVTDEAMRAAIIAFAERAILRQKPQRPPSKTRVSG